MIYNVGVDTEKFSMSYREKAAWLSLLAIAVAFVPYFTVSVMQPPEAQPLPNLPQLRNFVIAVMVQVAIIGLGHLALRLRLRDEAKLPPDERDSDILRRSTISAYYTMMVGICLVGCVLPFYSSGWEIINPALFTIILAESIRYGVVVYSYRRQA